MTETRTTETRMQIETRMPIWLRWLLTFGVFLFVISLAVKGYHEYSRSTTLTIAASDEGENIKILNALAGRLKSTKARVRLKVVPTGDMAESAALFTEGKADLAVLRADVGNQGTARTVVVAAQPVVLVLLPANSAAQNFGDLKEKTIGVINGDVNKRVVDVLVANYALDRARFHNVTPDEARDQLQSKQLHALLVVTTLTERSLSHARWVLGLHANEKPGVIAIDQAEAIATYARYFEMYELPKGTLWGSPPVPDEEMTTLRVPINIVAAARLNADVVTTLTRAIMESRGALASEFPVLSLIRTPPTDKDAYIPLHPGAATYYEGNEKTFFDRYGDPLFYGTMMAGALASLLAGLWRFLGIGSRPVPKNALLVLAGLLGKVRDIGTEEELADLEDRIDLVVQNELIAEARGVGTTDAGTLSLVVSRCEKAIDRRRQAIRKAEAANPLVPTRPTLVG